MNDSLAELITQLGALERDIERKIEERRKALGLKIKNGRAEFERDVITGHRKLKKNLIVFLLSSPLVFYLTSPIIYSLIIPLVLIDLWISAYQWICFRAWGIALAKRSDYIALDRHRLAYLNGIQKLNCQYCGYANGVIAFAREVASRTEQFWCPIKHAIRIKGAHVRYRDFLDYGDAAGFVKKSEEFRRRLKEIPAEADQDYPA